MSFRQTRETMSDIAGVIQGGEFTATDELVLFQSTFTPTAISTLADFDSNRIAATDTVPFTMAGGWASGVAPDAGWILIANDLAEFIPAVTAVFPFIAGGWYVRDVGDNSLLASGVFDTPIVFNSEFDILKVKAILSGDAIGDQDAEFIAGP